MHYHYTLLEWPDVETIIRLANLLPTKGLSVTIPFKTDVMRHLDEVDDHAEAIGAVNTVVWCGARMYGHNTDWLGVRAPLAHRRGARAVVLGAGVRRLRRFMPSYRSIWMLRCSPGVLMQRGGLPGGSGAGGGCWKSSGGLTSMWW